RASRVGVASAKSATSRTYWAMVIAGEYEPPPKAAGKKTTPAAPKKPAAQSCRVRVLSICF
ncbi:MAG TPA: CAP domain-containing protein, partial [Bradyrhizobium sp.]|nr:CAP domain-containing protein [Bradyrhizobium sp.]